MLLCGGLRGFSQDRVSQRFVEQNIMLLCGGLHGFSGDRVSQRFVEQNIMLLMEVLAASPGGLQSFFPVQGSKALMGTFEMEKAWVTTTNFSRGFAEAVH